MARPRKPEVLERLARSAVDHFAREGYQGTRMADVAESAGVSPGTIYNYVESKEALFYLLVDWGMGDGPPPLPDELPLPTPAPEQLLKRLKEQVGSDFRLSRLDRALDRTRPAAWETELREILEEFYDRTAETRVPADVLERSASELPEELGKFFYELRGSIFDRFTRYLSARFEAEDLHRLGPPDVVARLLVESITYAARHRHRDLDAGERADGSYRASTVQLWVRALGPRTKGTVDA